MGISKDDVVRVLGVKDYDSRTPFGKLDLIERVIPGPSVIGSIGIVREINGPKEGCWDWCLIEFLHPTIRSAEPYPKRGFKAFWLLEKVVNSL